MTTIEKLEQALRRLNNERRAVSALSNELIRENERLKADLQRAIADEREAMARVAELELKR